jgi:ABC-type transport system involved in multi-copper enzyme maturation permease subunit/predicted RNA-binding Zn-ribbon protein involved in translation (DUF1610 family)
MMFPAIADRELSARARQGATYRNRLIAGAVAVGIVTVMMLFGELFNSMRSIGKPMFYTLAWLSFAFCLIEGLRNTVDCLSSEKREGTLGLLMLTDVTGLDLVLGKLAVNSLASVYGLLAAFPALAMPFILGGVTAGEFWRLLLALLNALFFGLAAGLFISSCGRDERTVWSAGLILVGGVTVLPPLVDLLIAGGDLALVVPFFGLVSPVQALLSLGDEGYRLDPATYWSAFGMCHLLAWGCLVGGGIALMRTWRADDAGGTRFAWWRKLRQRKWRPRRAARAGGLRKRHPLLWLAEDEGPPLLMYFMMALGGGLAVAFLWTGGSATTPNFWIALLLFWLLHWALRLWTAAQACHAMSSLRDSGMMELLLSAPVVTREVAEAVVRARMQNTLPLVAVIGGFEVVGLIGLLFFADRNTVDVLWIGLIGFFCAMTILHADIRAVNYAGLWYGLVMHQPGAAVQRTIMRVLILPLLVLLLIPFGLFFCGLGIPICFVAKAAVFINMMRDRLNFQLRQAATTPFDLPDRSRWWWPWGTGRRTDTLSPPHLMGLTCPSCRRAVYGWFIRCPHCGWIKPPPLIQGPTCTSCGQNMGGAHSHCPHCGWTQPGARRA